MRHMKAAVGAHPLLPRCHHRTQRRGEHPYPQEWPSEGGGLSSCPGPHRNPARHALLWQGVWGAIAARDPDHQTAEIHSRVALMNRFNALGPAEIVRVARSRRAKVKSSRRPTSCNRAQMAAFLFRCVCYAVSPLRRQAAFRPQPPPPTKKCPFRGTFRCVVWSGP